MYRPARTVGTVLLCGLLVLAVPAPVVAHGNYLAVDTQISTDGTVRIEGAFLITDGYVVLHDDDAGELGEVLGHIKPEQNTFQGALSVGINRSYWADVSGSRSLWAVLHYDADNDGSFQAGDDPPIGGSADPDWAVNFRVERGDQPAYVLAELEHAQQTNTSEVEIRRVQLPADGYLVLRSDANGEPGEVIGNRSLAAGSHQNVSVSIAEHDYHHRPETFRLWAVVYRGDGSGSFDAGDVPVTVNGTPVASSFEVERTGELDAGHQHTPSPTATAEPPTETEPTETGSHESGGDHDHEQTETTRSPTASPAPTPAETPETQSSPTSSPGQPGFGILSVLIGGLLALAAAKRRF